MKKLTILFVTLLVTSLTYSQVVTDGLIAYWGLDGTADDTAGVNDWHGTATGGFYSTNRFDAPGSAYDFGTNGSADIWIPNVQRSSQAFALSMWIYPTEIDLAGGHWAINQRGTPIDKDQFQIMYLQNGTWFGISHGTTNDKWQFLQRSPLIANQWNHVVLQTEGTAGSAIEMYVNNVAQTPGTLPDNMSYDLSQNIRVGKQAWGGSNGGQLDGKVDDIAMYGRILTAAEVDLIYNYDPDGMGGDCLWTDNGTNIYRIGPVAVNTQTLPSGFDFAVDGKAVAKEVKVTLSGWADFVFEEDYALPTLEEVEKHIEKKGHLPSIPSAKEVEEEGGFSLGEMNKILLQKIEELTLYTIEQEKRIKALEKKLATKKD